MLRPVQELPYSKTMNRRLFTAAATAIPFTSTRAAKPDAVKADFLLGAWDVDLRPNPAAPAYLKTLVVNTVSGNTFGGTFYDAEISEGRINVDWGTVRIAFITTDASGPYNHSAVLREGRLEGLTNSVGRKFLAYWSATKK
jgi:hypothetical protein